MARDFWAQGFESQLVTKAASSLSSSGILSIRPQFWRHFGDGALDNLRDVYFRSVNTVRFEWVDTLRSEDTFEMTAVMHARLDANDQHVFMDTRSMVGAALLEYLVNRGATECRYTPPAGTNLSLFTKLSSACEDLRLGLSADGIRRIYRTRNKLMHAMRFATDDRAKEYLLIGHALNVLTLRLLHYTGPYIDRRSWQRRTLTPIASESA
jgi:hypothetical protein